MRLGTYKGIHMTRPNTEVTKHEVLNVLKKKQKEYLKGGKVEVDSNNPKCIVCGKPVFGSYFVVLTNNCVAHIACANKNK